MLAERLNPNQGNAKAPEYIPLSPGQLMEVKVRIVHTLINSLGKMAAGEGTDAFMRGIEAFDRAMRIANGIGWSTDNALAIAVHVRDEERSGRI